MESSRKRRMMWAAVIGLAVLVAAAAWIFLAPTPSQTLDEAAPDSALAMRSGAFRDGDSFHKASGNVQLLQDSGRYLLHFSDYQATAGPDVYFYLTRAAGASTTEAVEGQGTKLPTATTTGQATLRGAFNVMLPGGIDPSAYDGITIWCDAYNVLFGWAEFQ